MWHRTKLKWVPAKALATATVTDTRQLTIVQDAMDDP